MSKKIYKDIFDEVNCKGIHEESFISWGVNKLILKKLFGKHGVKLWGANKFKSNG